MKQLADVPGYLYNVRPDKVLLQEFKNKVGGDEGI
jgi:hypothetical protein